MNSIKLTKSLAVVALGGAMLLAGCNDYLDREPLGRYTEKDIPAGSFDSQVFGVYARMRAFGVSALPYIAIHNIRSDDAGKGSSVTDGVDTENIFDKFQYVKDQWLINGYWNDHYALINAANAVISDIDSVGATDPATQVNLGEAKFMRAYAYFNLVRTYGEVPKIDFKITNAAQANIPKSPTNVIFALIDSDLQAAAAVLPATWGAAYAGRLTRGAARALHTKSMMWRKDWAGALAMAKQVINSGNYSLVKDYSSIFRNEGENNAESIFEIQAYYDISQTNLGIQYAQVQGVRGSGEWNLGWGFNTPTEDLAMAFEKGDPRKDGTLLYSGQVNAPFNERVPPATSSIPRPYWNKKVYTDPNDRAAKANRAGRWMNLRVIRYADVLLWAAEAANELGETADALKWLEMVRARARAGNNAILPEIKTTDKAALRDIIHHERRVEFGMENERFFDLVRWGKADEVLRQLGYQSRNRYLPIPQGEIDKSKGVLVQNPEY